MARRAKIARSLRPQRFAVREHHRCQLCGRARAYIRFFGLCRLCFRTLALRGELPGIRKASW